MQPRTIGILLELAKASWFSRVGIKDTETAIILSSWPEAIGKSYEWELLCAEAASRYCERLAERSKELSRLWYVVVDEVKAFTDPLVERKIAAIVREHNLPETFAALVRADIAGVCAESEYADVCPPGFFSSNAYWYVHGHFPCGWQGGVPPKGRPVIY